MPSSVIAAVPFGLVAGMAFVFGLNLLATYFFLFASSGFKL